MPKKQRKYIKIRGANEHNLKCIDVDIPRAVSYTHLLANAITDTPVLMAAKAHMRNGKPLVIAISTNDALGASFKNIGMLMNTCLLYPSRCV